MEYEQIKAFVIVLLAIFGAIVAVDKAVQVIRGWTKPGSDLKSRVDRHDQMLANDKARLDAIEGDNRVTLTCLGAILDHQITGNSIEKMKKARETLTEHLIER